MKVYVVQLSKYDSWLSIKYRVNVKAYSERVDANNYIARWALGFAKRGYSVSLINNGVYINTMKAEKPNTKICEEEIIELAVKEMEVI